MRRIGLAVVLSLVLAPLGVKAQPTRNVHPIGFLGPTPSAGGLVQVAFRDIRALTIWVSGSLMRTFSGSRRTSLACGRASCERPAARVPRALVRPSRSPSAAPCGRSRRRRRAVGSRDRRRARRLPARRPGASSRSRCPARGAARATHSAARAAHRCCRRACPPRRDHRACSGLGSGVAKARSWRVLLYAITRLPSSLIGSVPGWSSANVANPHDDLVARGAHERLESLRVVARPYFYRYTRCATGSNANLVLVRAGARRWETWLKTWPRPPHRVSHFSQRQPTGERKTPQRISNLPRGERRAWFLPPARLPVSLHALRTWLDSWARIGHVAVGMARQGYDLQLTRYDEKKWRAIFYTTGMEPQQESRMDNILARTAQFQPAARARRFFCFFLKAARLRAVFLRFFSRMAVSYRLGEGQCSMTSVDHRPPVPRRTTAVK